jgi:hypothetical protein
MLCFLMFLCCLDFGVWIIELKFFLFSLLFSSPFFIFFLCPFCFFFSLLFYCLASLPYFAAWLISHLKYLLTPPICCFATLLPCTSLSHCLATSLLCVGWYFPPPSSFVGRSLELGEASYPATTREGLI